jgi:glycosyltransferase involved in cell wall biosynthesis
VKLPHYTPFLFQTVGLPQAARPVLCGIIDVEEGFDWDKPFRRDGYQTDAIEELSQLQEILDAYGLRPVLAIDYPMASDPRSIELLRPLVEQGRGVLAAQMHPWVTPPFQEELSEQNTIAGNLPFEIELAKMEMLLQQVESAFGQKPIIYRAGRHGVGPNTAEIMKRTGLEIDISLQAYRHFPETFEQSFLGVGPNPFAFGRNGQLLALPHTAGFLGRFGADGQGFYRYLQLGRRRSKRLLASISSRAGILERVALSPESCDLPTAKRLVRTLLNRGTRYFCFALHNTSLKTGHSPYTKSTKDVDRILTWVKEFLEFFVKEIGGELSDPVTLRDRFRAGYYLPRPSASPMAASDSTITAVIPTYNRANLVANAIDSILNQTRPADEIIVVDDGSSDGTRDLIAGYGDRIRYVYQENQGVAAARNTGLRNAKSTYLAYLDSDDLWEPSKLEYELKAIAIRPDIAIAFSESSVWRSSTEKVSESFFALSNYSYNYFREAPVFSSLAEVDGPQGESVVLVGDFSSAIFFGNLVQMPNCLFKTRLLRECGEFDTRIGNAGEDYDLISRIVQNGVCAFICVSGARVRRGGTDHLYQLSALMARNNQHTMNAILQHRNGQIDFPKSLIAQRWAKANAWYGLKQFEIGQYADARTLLWNAVWKGERDVATLGHLALTALPSGLQQPILSVFRKFRNGLS